MKHGLILLIASVIPILAASSAFAAPAGVEYEGHDFAYWSARADYYKRFQNPLNYHPNDGISERLEAIEALGHFGSNAVPKLISIFNDLKRPEVEQWAAVDAFGSIGPDAVSASPFLITYATNALWQGKSMSSTSTGKSIDALAAIRATNVVPELIVMFSEIEACGTKLSAETRASHLVRLINALQKLASPSDAKAIIPTLEKILAAPPTKSAPANRANWTMEFYLQEYAQNFLHKLRKGEK
jgi:hypothetical protein